MLQLNIIGSRKVTDFDGSELSEKELAVEIWRALHADLPVFPGAGRPAQGAGTAKREVSRLPGYMRPDDFLAMFRYVREKAYESKSFRDFVKALPS